MNIGFTGTREGLADAQRASLGVLLTFDLQPTVWRHGSCKGADVEAAQLVRYIHEAACRIIAHPGPDNDPCRTLSGVDDETLPGKAHFARNRDIVDASEVLIACPVSMEILSHGGTAYTVNFGIKNGKRVIICWPDGTVSDRG